jgi:hypothetical protein
VKAGCSPEDTSWNKLVKRAVQYEAAEQLWKKEISNTSFGGRNFRERQDNDVKQLTFKVKNQGMLKGPAAAKTTGPGRPHRTPLT